MRRRRKIGLAAALATGVAWQRVSANACPYAARWLLHFPRPWISAEALVGVLEPRPGERLLEIGPGLGHGALPVAERLAPDGVVVGLDLQ